MDGSTRGRMHRLGFYWNMEYKEKVEELHRVCFLLVEEYKHLLVKIKKVRNIHTEFLLIEEYAFLLMEKLLSSVEYVFY